MAGTDTFKRKEVKFLLSESQKKSFLEAIRSSIIGDDYGKYSICNIYMDTPDSRLIRKSIEKPVFKEKMRVRSYGIAEKDAKVFVELKKKYKGIVYKRRVQMSIEDARLFIQRNRVKNGQVEEEIDYFLEVNEGIMPAMYIAYEREAFKGAKDPQLRITFDHNILWRVNDLSLSSNIYGRPILEKGQEVMEIKCADAMPLWLTKALSANNIYKTSFSKYGKAYISLQEKENKQCQTYSMSS